MANDIKYAVIFSAVDQLSDKLSSFGGGFDTLGDKTVAFASKLGEAGESLRGFGERLSIDAALMKDGADQLRELSDAISEPAFAAQKALQTTAALTGENATQLAKLKDMAVAFSNTHAGVTVEGWISGYTRFREIYQDTEKAIAGEDTAAMLSRFGVEGEASANLLGVAYRNLGVDAKTAGDQFFKMTTQWGVEADSTQQVARAVAQLGGQAASTGTSYGELLSIVGAASSSLGGGRGVMQFASMVRELVDSGKGGLNWTHGFADGFAQLKNSIAGLPATEKLESLKKMGISNPGEMLTFLDQLDKVNAATRANVSAAGALGVGFTTATSDAADQLALMHQNLSTLYDSMASPALPFFSASFGELTKFIQGATAASDKYSWATKDLVIGLSIAGTGLGGAASALSTLGMATIGIGNSWKALSYVPTILGAMISPMGLVVIGAAALAVAGYEIYEHWNGIKTFFSGIGNWLGAWAPTIGKAVLMGIAGPFGMIAGEIYSHWDSIKAACERLGSGILSYFEGHSPPKVGPLSHLGEHITIAETVAEHIRPAPVLAAIRRTAAAAAIASTTIVAGAAGPALAGGAAPGAGGGIVINAPITIVAPAGADVSAFERSVMKALEHHRYELSRLLDNQKAQVQRTQLL